MKRKITESEVYQEIDLSEIYGRNPTIEELVEFADMAKNEIIDRTQGGRDINGERFPKYTKDYADFKGVSRSDVDLTLFGEMLNSIDTQIRGSRVFISMDQDQAAKAHGNITGSYGKDSPNSEKARDFFGLRDDDAKKIADKAKVISNDQTLLDILGTAPIPDAPEAINITQILSAIGFEIDQG